MIANFAVGFAMSLVGYFILWIAIGKEEARRNADMMDFFKLQGKYALKVNHE